MALQHFVSRFSSKYRGITVFALCLLGVAFINQFNLKSNMLWYAEQISVLEVVEHDKIVAEFYEKRKAWNTSVLGAILYKNEPYPTINLARKNQKFVILIYKTWNFLQKRHLYYFGSTRHDPLEGCSVNNCEFTGDDKDFSTADAVIVHLHRGLIPKMENRNRTQRWIFLDDEAPRNSFSLAKRPVKLQEVYDIFNWSMTYRSDADVPVPYGRTVAIKLPKITSSDQSITNFIPNWTVKSDEVLVAILISNCGIPYRNNLIKELKLHLKVDVHGNCGEEALKKSCPGHFRKDCEVMSKYLFYLVLENTKCKEYITEKLFQNAYTRGAIPIIQGPSVEDCEKFLPPNSYLHIDNYSSMEALANDIINISKDKDRLLSYHAWRNHFEVLNEHGYFGSKSYHLCRVCEAINYNDRKEKVYRERDIKNFLGQVTLCRN